MPHLEPQENQLNYITLGRVSNIFHPDPRLADSHSEYRTDCAPDFHHSTRKSETEKSPNTRKGNEGE